MAREIKGNKDEIVNLLIKLYDESRGSSYRIQLEKNWEEYQKLYLSNVDPKTFPWEGASNVDLGIVEMTVDNIKSRYQMSTLAEKPFFNALPRTKAGEEHQKLVQDAMSWILDHHIKIGNVYDKVTHNVAKFGTSFTKRRWQISRREINQMNFSPELGMTTQMGWLTETKGCADVIDLQHLFFPEDADDDIQNCYFAFHRIYLSPSQLRERINPPFEYDKEGVEKADAFFKKQITEKEKTAAQKQEKIPQKLPQNKIELLECYIFYDGDGDTFDEQCIFTICPDANAYLKGRFLADIYYDGLRPFNRFIYKDVGLLYGRGIPAMLKNYREAMNTVFNQGVDCTMMQIIPWFFYRYASSFKPEEVKLCPGKGIPVDDINDVRIATFPATAPVIGQIIELMMIFIERQTGISAPQTGQVSEGRTTAYEIGAVISEGNIKHQDRILAFHRESADFLEGIYHLYRQNMTSDMVMRLIPDAGNIQYFSPDPASFIPEYDFIILGSLTMGNKDAEKQNAVALYNLLMSNPYINQNPKAVNELLRDLLTHFDKRNSEKYLPPQEVIDALYEKQQQTIMSGGQPGGGERQEGEGGNQNQ